MLGCNNAAWWCCVSFGSHCPPGSVPLPCRDPSRGIGAQRHRQRRRSSAMPLVDGRSFIVARVFHRAHAEVYIPPEPGIAAFGVCGLMRAKKCPLSREASLRRRCRPRAHAAASNRYLHPRRLRGGVNSVPGQRMRSPPVVGGERHRAGRASYGTPASAGAEALAKEALRAAELQGVLQVRPPPSEKSRDSSWNPIDPGSLENTKETWRPCYQ